mmetsp:Transcript_28019/g.54615  ORF Transcript_28019/g.54615 Transcript_28019/m.54615 type:complete len:97 (+) Transcript_28019:684-974(+)
MDSFMLSPIPNMTTEVTPIKALEEKMERCNDDPYDEGVAKDRRDSGRFKPSKKKKDEVSPATAKKFEDKGKEHFDKTKAFYEIVDGESMGDCFEFE